MSTYQAIGGVSETLRLLLEDRIELPDDAVANFRVSIGPPRPDSQVILDAAENPRINLFLYRVLENGSLKNQEIPGHGNPSSYGSPPLSLDLHYLITAYGTRQTQTHFNETLAHFLLGSAMRVFHDFAIITEELRTVRPPVGMEILHESLRGEFERVKLSLEPVSLEDISKVFTALTLPFRVGAAYNVSVIQIESLRRRQFARRVQPPPQAGPRIVVVPLRRPRIQELAVRWQGDPPGSERPFPYVHVNDTLILKGTNFSSAATRVRFGFLEVPVGLTNDQRIELAVPDATLPDGSPIAPERRLQPGAHTAEVITGAVEIPSAGFVSNQAVFMLVPRVLNAAANLAVTPRTVQVNGTRLFQERLTGEAVAGRAVIPSDLYQNPTSTLITFPLPDNLVAWPVATLTSGQLAPFPNLPNNPPPSISVTVGADGPRIARFPRRPTDTADAAQLLEAALRIAQTAGPPPSPPPGPGFSAARVAATQDDRLVIVPGQLAGPVVVDPDAISAQLRLTPASGSTTPQVYLSGELFPFPAMAAAQPRLRLTIGPVSHDLTLAARPQSLGEAAALLEAAIRAFPEAAFANARVTTVDQQLLILPGAAGAVTFAPIPGVDEASVGELELFSDVPVRVRANAAESLDEILVDLTL